jgi:hypothetical protein
MAYSFKDSDLTSEKSLWDVYKLSRRILPSRFQFFIIASMILLLGVNAFVLSDYYLIILKDVRGWAELGFNF